MSDDFNFAAIEATLMTDGYLPAPDIAPDEVALTILLQEDRAADLHDLADAVSDPTHPQYGQYITAKELSEWVTPDDTARDAVTAWLTAYDFRPIDGLPNRQVLFFAAPADRIGDAFGNQAKRWLFDHHADRAQRMEWKIPRAVAGYVESVQIVHDNGSQTHCLRQGQWLSADTAASDPAGRAPVPEGLGGFTPADVSRMYGFDPALDGTGETIALLMLGSAPSLDDLEHFWESHGIKRTGWTEVVRLGPQMPGESDLGTLEAAMTAQWAGAMAPGANLVIFVIDERAVANPWTTLLLAAVSDAPRRPTIVVITWLLPERSYYSVHGTTPLVGLLDQCAALGITVISASGDWGCFDSFPRTRVGSVSVADAPWPHAVFPAVEERVLSVGGTMITQQAPHTETAWSGPLPPSLADQDSMPFLRFAGGGGFSAEVPMPEWQRPVLVDSAGNPRAFSRGWREPAVLAYGRGVPDVALAAAGRPVHRHGDTQITTDGYRALVKGQWIDYAGGTSTAAPIWAAIIACANQARADAAGAGPDDSPRARRALGFVNPLLYTMAQAFFDDADRARLLREAARHGESPFREITQGRADVVVRALGPDVTGLGFGAAEREISGYAATPRWDPVTGLGVPRVARLCALLASDAIPGVTP